MSKLTPSRRCQRVARVGEWCLSHLILVVAEVGPCKDGPPCFFGVDARHDTEIDPKTEKFCVISGKIA